MWINKHVWAQLQDLVSSMKELGNYHVNEIAKRDRALADLHARHAEAEAAKRAALVRADLMTLRVNQLQDERDQLLTKLMPDLKISTPRIQEAPILMPPGIDFEDIGDDRADLEGHDRHPAPAVHDPDVVEGMIGQTVTPPTR